MAGEKNDPFEEVAKRIAGYKNEMVDFQKQLTPIVALGPENGGQGEWKRARFLKDKLAAFGLTDVTEFNSQDKRVPEGTRPNLVVRLKGKASHPAIWVMAHMDTVPPGDESRWDTKPFEVVEKDGKLYGRGVEDNQQGLVSALFAMKALVDEKVTPPGDVCLMLVSDEETGNALGIEHVLKSAPDLITKEDIVIVPDGGNPDGSMVEVAEKSILWCKFQVLGKQVHASTPDAGINSHRAAVHLGVLLDEQLKKIYAKLEPVFDPPGSTFELTKRDANVPNVNTIPGEDCFYLDCRILPNYDVDEVIATIRKLTQEIEERFKVKVNLSFPQMAKSAPATSTDAPVVRLLSEAISKVKKDVKPVPMGIGGGTVAALFRKNGIPAAVWSTMDDLAHQPNEYIVIDNMVVDAKVFGYIFVKGWAK